MFIDLPNHDSQPRQGWHIDESHSHFTLTGFLDEGRFRAINILPLTGFVDLKRRECLEAATFLPGQIPKLNHE